MTAPAASHVKDMATTWDDFVRLLPVALAGWPYRIKNAGVDIGSADRGASIAVEALPPRQFGPVPIPRSRVVLTFHGMTAAESDAFLRQFDRAFQRGGG
jgi:hypothetical protein